MKTTILSLSMLALTFVSNTCAAQSFPTLCDAGFEITGSIMEVNDTVYSCGIDWLTFNDTSSLDGSLITREWVFGDGNDELNGMQFPSITHIYEMEGIYTASLKVVSSGCPAITIEKTIILLGNPDFDVVTQEEIYCYGECNGKLYIDLYTDSPDLYNVEWSGVGLAQFTAPPTGNNPYIGLCAGDYTFVITDVFGCTYPDTVDVSLTEPDLLQVSIVQGDTLALCPASGVTDITLSLSGGVGTYLTTWEMSSAIVEVDETTMEFTPLAQSLDQMYTVFVQDMNDCPGSDSIYIASLPSTLQGSVSVGADPCTNCEVVQYQYSTDVGSWVPQNTTLTDGTGDFNLGIVTNFMPFAIMADPDPVNYPMAVPAFYPQGHLWEDAEIFDVCGETLNKHIPIDAPMNFNGSNTFKGTVYYSQSWKMETDEDPIPLIDVVVEKTPPGQAQGRRITNPDGSYAFTLVPNSDTLYTLYVNIPGVPVNSTYEIMAVQGGQVFDHLDFCLAPDSSAIDICNGGELSVSQPMASEQGSFRMYPNPSNGRFSIETGKFAENASDLQIVDLMGRIVFHKQYAVTPAVINMVNVAEGYYLVRMINDSEADSSPIQIMKN